MKYEISRVTLVTADLVSAFERLAPQLSTAPPPGWSELEKIVASEATLLLIARQNPPDGAIIGTLALALGRVPTGLRAWIEDVVVDQTARGQGVGEALTRAALQYAREKGVKVVELTSNPTRQAANRLYQRIGFVRPQTNFYRYYLDEP